MPWRTQFEPDDDSDTSDGEEEEEVVDEGGKGIRVDKLFRGGESKAAALELQVSRRAAFKTVVLCCNLIFSLHPIVMIQL